MIYFTVLHFNNIFYTACINTNVFIVDYPKSPCYINEFYHTSPIFFSSVVVKRMQQFLKVSKREPPQQHSLAGQIRTTRCLILSGHACFFSLTIVSHCNLPLVPALPDPVGGPVASNSGNGSSLHVLIPE